MLEYQVQQLDQCCITATEPGTSLIDGQVTGSEQGSHTVFMDNSVFLPMANSFHTKGNFTRNTKCEQTVFCSICRESLMNLLMSFPSVITLYCLIMLSGY